MLRAPPVAGGRSAKFEVELDVRGPDAVGAAPIRKTRQVATAPRGPN